jgi:hypothetical protein
MKGNFYFILSLAAWQVQLVNSQNIAVNTTGAAAASTNMLEVTQSGTAANTVAVYAGHSGAIAGTGYGLFSTKTGASTTNIGGYFNASGGTNNYAIIVPPGGGQVGIGNSTPVSSLDVAAGTTTVNSVVNATGSINDFLQYNVQNTSTGTQAQSGYSATADNGTATTGFAWMGINNSAFNYPTAYNIGGANDVSFLGSGQDMYIANAHNTKSIIFSTGKSTTPFFNERMRITNAGSVGIGTAAPASTLDVQGSLGFKTTVVTAATTLNQTHNVLLGNDATGSFTITLPAAASNAGKTYYIKKTNSSANTITIDGNASETIDGALTLLLYVQYDAIRIVCDGSNWFVMENGIKPHQCKLRRVAVQSISNATYTYISFDSEDYDIGSIADPVTNHRVDIRRAGKYMITGYTRFPSVLDAAESLAGYIDVNGVSRISGVTYSPTTNQSVFLSVSVILDLAAGDYIQFNLWQNEGASQNTDITDPSEPTLTVYEIR